MNPDKKTTAKEQGPGSATYAVVWLCLLALTALTVTAARIHLGKITIIICLAIAAVKSTLVLLFFMHLRYEKRLIIRLLIPGAILLLAVFIGLTFSDIFTR